MKQNKKLFFNFYNTQRLSINMSDSGGAFGFDIHHALEVCFLIEKYNCETIIETGTNCGDTSEFLAKQFPTKKILTCETNINLFNIAYDRLKKYKNVKVINESGEKVVKNTKTKLAFYYLDAHWEKYWPLEDELKFLKTGVVCVGDFDINKKGYSFDSYNGKKIDKNLILNNIKVSNIYTNNPNFLYPYPCLQKKRLGGRGYFTLGIEKDYFKSSNCFSII